MTNSMEEGPVSSSEELPPAAPVPSAGTDVPPLDAAPADVGSVDAGRPETAPALSVERIAAQVAALDSAGALPLTEQVELYQRLHGELQSALAEIDKP